MLRTTVISSGKHFLITLAIGSIFLCNSCKTTGLGSDGIMANWGDRVGYGLHPAIDYALPLGTPIIASADGVVYISEVDYKYGNGAVGIQHSDCKTLYVHLQKIFVRKNEKIKRGQLIGTSSGWATSGGPHLHFGVLHYFAVDGHDFKTSYNPNLRGINNGPPKCFDPKRDYSDYPQDAITLPFPCSEHMEYYMKKIKEDW